MYELIACVQPANENARNLKFVVQFLKISVKPSSSFVSVVFTFKSGRLLCCFRTRIHRRFPRDVILGLLFDALTNNSTVYVVYSSPAKTHALIRKTKYSLNCKVNGMQTKRKRANKIRLNSIAN